MAEFKDARFASFVKDPKFRRIHKKDKKVVVDKRFKDPLKNNKAFKVEFRDKRGGPKFASSNENYQHFYVLSDDEEDTKNTPGSEEERSDDDFNFSSNGELLRIKKASSFEDEEQNNEEENKFDKKKNKEQLKLRNKDENEKIPKPVKKKLCDINTDYARGEGQLFSDSSSDDSSDDDAEGYENEIVHDWGELDKDAETREDATSRLALCNLDWDNVRAVDLMVAFQSVAPGGSTVKSVTIYPSEYGLKRMKEEEIHGPKELVENKKNTEAKDEDETEEGSSYHREKLREYQINRLKYFYAVVVCDSAATADTIYKECDGIELALTSAKMDLRFIPDDITFDQEPRESCTEMPQPGKYKPREMVTAALQQVKVDLTWDMTDPKRKAMIDKINDDKYEEIDDEDIKDLFASDSSEDEADENMKHEPEEGTQKMSTVEKFRALLKEIDEQEEEKKKNKGKVFECTWDLEVEKKATEKEKMKSSKNLTPFEEFIEKKTEKKALKRENRLEKDRLKSNEDYSDTEDSTPWNVDMVMDELDDGKSHFDMKKIVEEQSMTKSKRKRLEKKKKIKISEDTFVPDVHDSRFERLYTSHKFNIDPSHQQYKKTKGTEAFINEKLKRRGEKQRNN